MDNETKLAVRHITGKRTDPSKATNKTLEEKVRGINFSHQELLELKRLYGHKELKT